MRRRAALFPSWFHGLASAVHAVEPLSISVHADGYFTGVVTAPIVGVVGMALLLSLQIVTRASTRAQALDDDELQRDDDQQDDER